MTTTLPAIPVTRAMPTVDLRTIGIEPAPAYLGGAALMSARHARAAVVLRYGNHASVVAVDTDLEPVRGDTRTWQARFVEVLDRWAARSHATVQASQWPTCGRCLAPQSGEPDGCPDESGHRELDAQREMSWWAPRPAEVSNDLTVWSPR